MEPMNQYEHSRRQYLERRIQELKAILLDTSASLQEIKKDHLFRNEHEDFFGYCARVWNLRPGFVTVLIERMYEND